MPTKKRVIFWSFTGIVVIVLLGVAAVVVPILTHTSAGKSGQVLKSDYAPRVSATGDDGRTRKLAVTDASGKDIDAAALVAGEKVVVKGTGFDPGIGIYVSFCELPDAANKKPGPCLGDVPASEDAAEDADPKQLSSAWVTNNWAWKNFATDRFDGEGFTVRLVVPPPTGNGANCQEHRCAIVTRADHTASKDRVQDIAVPVKWRTKE
jgi:hypothetical protein